MISDESQRYLLTQIGAELWRYDARWRSSSLVDVSAGQPIQVAEGRNYLSVTTQVDGAVSVSVHGPKTPESALARGMYTADKGWSFEGDNQAWAGVSDYVLVSGADDRPGLLRIADGAQLDPLIGIDGVTQAIDIPESRLLILVGSGGWSVYDPVTRRSFQRRELANKNNSAIMRFRSSDEVWINDDETMVKLNAKTFDVIDAAGSQIDAEIPGLGVFGRWTFSSGNELCVVPPPNLGDVLILDSLSMLPVAQATFTTATPIDAIMIRRNVVVGVAEDGRVLRARAKRVRVEHPPAPSVD